QVLAFVTCPPETSLPTPRLEIVGNPSHLTSKADIKNVIIVGELFVPWTGVIEASEPITGGHRETRSIRKEIWNRRTCHGERNKRIDGWPVDTGGTESDVRVGPFKWIRRKRNSCRRGIKERPRDFEIRKDRQVFVAQIARKGAIEDLPVCRWQGRCESGK